ncbi:hypothetical protein CH63R_13369 [Colletotrichum higginsianum IMI 349063]|uniref:Uncharacterized protein n=1 Tax=Colletotrichum higginsianum (strain IMI 349063) TaxID=759273 RepID=A0A1B7XWV3_COLHI|nr:hypothetical protein CH63R_13369 [Colletotrichum higginsianum IMI 349063]OBR04242.1 hypothetical protein CH63R_13369 [Colletotrichum higginsianum IMI 349063]
MSLRVLVKTRGASNCCHSFDVPFVSRHASFTLRVPLSVLSSETTGPRRLLDLHMAPASAAASVTRTIRRVLAARNVWPTPTNLVRFSLVSPISTEKGHSHYERQVVSAANDDFASSPLGDESRTRYPVSVSVPPSLPARSDIAASVASGRRDSASRAQTASHPISFEITAKSQTGSVGDGLMNPSALRDGMSGSRMLASNAVRLQRA